jgi:sulfite reductase (ferredoxin)
MNEGEILEIFVDDGEPVTNVCSNLESEGHKILLKEKINQNEWKVVIEIYPE